MGIILQAETQPQINPLVALFVFVPILLLYLMANSIILSRKSYACPSCGHVFRMKWYQLMFKMSGMAKYGDSELRLKCPSCGKTDFCKHTHIGE